MYYRISPNPRQPLLFLSKIYMKVKNKYEEIVSHKIIILLYNLMKPIKFNFKKKEPHNLALSLL